MCYLCYFVLFCMFDEYWKINCRSQISAGKSNVKALYFSSTKNISEKTDVPILSEDGLSQKGRLRWARRGPHHPWARGPPWPALARCGAPGPPQALPLRVLHPPETLRHGESVRKYSAASTRRKQQREKALRQGEICRGNSFPEGGRSSLSSSSSRWTSSGSPSSSSPPPSPPSPLHHLVPL